MCKSTFTKAESLIVHTIRRESCVGETTKSIEEGSEGGVD